MKEKCIDNYRNKDTYDVIQIIRLLYQDKHQLKLNRLSTYTRRATLSTEDIRVEMTEDQKCSISFINKCNGLICFGSYKN